tara:strand:+ start:1472 stop:1792 length:321 start_codon:yes stop_codon:yes gene_type:complete
MKENKLIAEFMGFTYEKNIGWYDNEMLMSQNVYDNQDGNCFDELLFDKSWDWLMSVVQKCLHIGDNTDNWDELYNAVSTINIETTYDAVVEFIKTIKLNNYERSRK